MRYLSQAKRAREGESERGSLKVLQFKNLQALRHKIHATDKTRTHTFKRSKSAAGTHTHTHTKGDIPKKINIRAHRQQTVCEAFHSCDSPIVSRSLVSVCVCVEKGALHAHTQGQTHAHTQPSTGWPVPVWFCFCFCQLSSVVFKWAFGLCPERRHLGNCNACAAS